MVVSFMGSSFLRWWSFSFDSTEARISSVERGSVLHVHSASFPNMLLVRRDPRQVAALAYLERDRLECVVGGRWTAVLYYRARIVSVRDHVPETGFSRLAGERPRRAEYATKSYFAKLALASAKARAKRTG
jgi:hypothetical protein